MCNTTQYLWLLIAHIPLHDTHHSGSGLGLLLLTLLLLLFAHLLYMNLSLKELLTVIFIYRKLATEIYHVLVS